MGWLLDTHPTQSYLLREQVNDLYEKRISNPLQLGQVRKDTEKLEGEGVRLLDLNEKLRVEVREAKESSTRHTLSPGSSVVLTYCLYCSVQEMLLNVYIYTVYKLHAESLLVYFAISYNI